MQRTRNVVSLLFALGTLWTAIQGVQLTAVCAQNATRPAAPTGNLNPTETYSPDLPMGEVDVEVVHDPAKPVADARFYLVDKRSRQRLYEYGIARPHYIAHSLSADGTLCILFAVAVVANPGGYQLVALKNPNAPRSLRFSAEDIPDPEALRRAARDRDGVTPGGGWAFELFSRRATKVLDTIDTSANVNEPEAQQHALSTLRSLQAQELNRVLAALDASLYSLSEFRTIKLPEHTMVQVRKVRAMEQKGSPPDAYRKQVRILNRMLLGHLVDNVGVVLRDIGGDPLKLPRLGNFFNQDDGADARDSNEIVWKWAIGAGPKYSEEANLDFRLVSNEFRAPFVYQLTPLNTRLTVQNTVVSVAANSPKAASLQTELKDHDPLAPRPSGAAFVKLFDIDLRTGRTLWRYGQPR